MSITFERIERDCDHNKNLRKDGEKIGILYDFKVLIGGEHRATIKKISYGAGYDVWDIDHNAIKENDNHHYPYSIKKQADFERDINLLWSKDRIPSLAQIEERINERARKKEAREAEEAEARRVHRIERHAVELLDALELCRDYIRDCGVVGTPGPALAAADAAITKARGTES